MALRVAVLMGGVSSESAISFRSGEACVAALRQEGFEVLPLDVTNDIPALVAALAPVPSTPAPDVVFNALHGRFGEDGSIQGLLDLMRIPYTHTGVMGSALAMDKGRAKVIVAKAGVRVPESKEVTLTELAQADPLPRPFVVKPVCEGSSVGVHILERGSNRTLSADDFVFSASLPTAGLMAERYVPGRELTVTVINDKALTVTELVPKFGFYDYEAKYRDGITDHILPADLPESTFREALDFAERAHRALGCRYLSRSDFRFDEKGDGKLYYLETNTQPGMASLSLVPEQAAFKGLPFSKLCRWLVEAAVAEGKGRPVSPFKETTEEEGG